jgi:hypothetical protein
MHLKFFKMADTPAAPGVPKRSPVRLASQDETLNSNNSLKTHNMGRKHILEEPVHQDLSIDTKFARK